MRGLHRKGVGSVTADEPKPDYARIRELEIELGMREPDAPVQRAACECTAPRPFDLVRMQDHLPVTVLCGNCGGSIRAPGTA